jgi:hypothetical protein
MGKERIDHPRHPGREGVVIAEALALGAGRDATRRSQVGAGSKTM